jgi:hypothetical protein
VSKELQEIAFRAINRFMARQFGDEFDYVVIVGEKGKNAPIVVHTMDNDDELAVALHTVIGGMMGLTADMPNGGDA